MAKVGRTQLLELELEEARLAAVVEKAKAKRPVCKTCGRLKGERNMTAAEKSAEKSLIEAKQAHREAARKFREARSG